MIVDSTSIKANDNIKTAYNSSTTLDNLLRNEAHIGVIKLDVENHEYNALMGAKSIISRDKPVIIIELHKTNPRYEDILRYLEDENYTTDGIQYAGNPTYIFIHRKNQP